MPQALLAKGDKGQPMPIASNLDFNSFCWRFFISHPRLPPQHDTKIAHDKHRNEQHDFLQVPMGVGSDGKINKTPHVLQSTQDCRIDSVRSALARGMFPMVLGREP